MDNYQDPSVGLAGCRVELAGRDPSVITLSIALTEFVLIVLWVLEVAASIFEAKYNFQRG